MTHNFGDIQDLKQRISVLEFENRHLNGLLEVKNNEINLLEQRNKELRSQPGNLNSPKGNVSLSNLEVERLKDRIFQKDKEINQLRQYVTDLNAGKEDSDNQLHQARDQVAFLTQRIEGREQDVEKLVEKLNLTAEENLKLQNRLRDSQQMIDQLQKTIHDVNHVNKSYSADSPIAGELDRIYKGIDDINRKLSTWSLGNAYHGLPNSANEEFEKMKRESEALKKENAQLKAEIFRMHNNASYHGSPTTKEGQNTSVGRPSIEQPKSSHNPGPRSPHRSLSHKSDSHIGYINNGIESRMDRPSLEKSPKRKIFTDDSPNKGSTRPTSIGENDNHAYRVETFGPSTNYPSTLPYQKPLEHNNLYGFDNKYHDAPRSPGIDRMPMSSQNSHLSPPKDNFYRGDLLGQSNGLDSKYQNFDRSSRVNQGPNGQFDGYSSGNTENRGNSLWQSGYDTGIKYPDTYGISQAPMDSHNSYLSPHEDRFFKGDSIQSRDHHEPYDKYQYPSRPSYLDTIEEKPQLSSSKFDGRRDPSSNLYGY